MDTENIHDAVLAARLRRLDASAAVATPAFAYDGLMQRQARRQQRSRHRLRAARVTAAALVVALVGASIWRLTPVATPPAVVAEQLTATAEPRAVQSRIVRADTYLAVAALEDHIAGLDEALNDARLRVPRGGEVARLERTRAELLDSWTQVRYAEMVSANF